MPTERSMNPTLAMASTVPLSTGQEVKPDPLIIPGIATQFWLALRMYPGDKNKRVLWLWVGEVLCQLDDPDPDVEAAVQSAFCNCPDSLEVAVWYRTELVPPCEKEKEAEKEKEKEKEDKKLNRVVGLVVRSNLNR